MDRPLVSLKPEMLEQTRQDVLRPSEEVDHEAQLHVPRRSLETARCRMKVQAKGGRHRQKRRPDQPSTSLGLCRELVKGIDRVEFAETGLHFRPHRIQTRHFFRGQHLGPDVREVKVVLSGLLVPHRHESGVMASQLPGSKGPFGKTRSRPPCRGSRALGAGATTPDEPLEVDCFAPRAMSDRTMIGSTLVWSRVRQKPRSRRSVRRPDVPEGGTSPVISS